MATPMGTPTATAIVTVVTPTTPRPAAIGFPARPTAAEAMRMVSVATAGALPVAAAYRPTTCN